MRCWVALLLGAVSCLLGANRPISVVLDTDIDDVLAPAFALQAPELELPAVNTVLQNRERRADLVWKILQVYGRTDIPVGMGAEQPLLVPPRTGIVSQTRVLSPEDRMPEGRRRNALGFLTDVCLQAPGKITVIAYGPLTLSRA